MKNKILFITEITNIVKYLYTYKQRAKPIDLILASDQLLSVIESLGR